MEGRRAIEGAPRLRMVGVHKRFGAVVALGGVDLSVGPGEVHALVGENGAGKSTLMKILSGALRPDGGTMELDGRPFAPTGPLDSLRRGVAMIYQELTLAPHLTVEQNAMLGRERRRLGLVDRARMRPIVVDALRALGHEDIDPETRVAGLGPGERQVVEVARALVADAQIIVMDEPTSSLSRSDTDRLIDLVHRLAHRGVTVIYISHFLEEIRRVAERYTVLRDGETVASGAVMGTALTDIVAQMVGRSVEEAFPRVAHEPGGPALSLEALGGKSMPRDASLVLRRGEILGIAGLVGAGRTEMLRAVFGLDPVRSGRITVTAVTDRGRPPWVRLAQGVGLLSENRKDEGLALGMTVAENVTLSRLGPASRLGWIDARRRDRLTARCIERLDVRCVGPRQRTHELSGGNQQKVALARLLHHDVDVLLLDEPTRGIDVGSKVEVYRLIGELAASGKAVLFVSSYVPELLGVCDRIAVMHRGRLGAARPAAEWTEAGLLDAAAVGAA